MSASWQFPMFIIPVQGGFASVSDNENSEPDQSLLVFSESSAAILFIATFDILSAPKAVNNEREFGWLLQSIRKPVTRILLDPNPLNPESSSGTQFLIDQVLANLKPDLSPWNYPVFAMATDIGFVTIDGAATDGEYLSAIGIFSSAERAHEYVEQSGDKGEPCEIKNREQAMIFLKGVSSIVGAVALDPVIIDGKHSAKYCFAMETLLTKYLVESGDTEKGD